MTDSPRDQSGAERPAISEAFGSWAADHRRLLAGLLGLAAFRLAMLALARIDLSGDEAYYWDWGRHPALGYFSKPPGIGWIMAVAGFVGGNTEFGVRAFAVLFGTLSVVFLHGAARRMYGPAVALAAALAFVLNPANAALNMILTIDAPLVCAWTGAMLAFWRFYETGFSSRRWAGVFSLALAAGMLSKQMMLVFPLLAALALLSDAPARALLRKPLLWFSVAFSLLAWLPPLIWNWRNQWVTVQHTMHHFNPAPMTANKIFGRFLEFIGIQLGLATPILGLLLAVALWLALRSWKTIGFREKFLFWLSAPGLCTLLLMNLRQRVNPNWPAVFYPGAIILLAAWVCGAWSARRESGSKLRPWFRPGLALAGAVTMVGYALLLLLGFNLASLGRFDVTGKIRGWSRIATDVARVQAGLPSDPPPLLITQSHRFLTSELAFYLPSQPTVYRFNPNPRALESQYDLWPNPPAGSQRDALLVVEGDPGDADPKLTNNFASTRLLETLIYQDSRGREKKYSLLFGQNLQHWP